jgi:hypothetical protein
MDLIIKEENKWKIRIAILELIEEALNNKIIDRSDIEKVIWDNNEEMTDREKLVEIINSFPLDEDILYLTEKAREDLVDKTLKEFMQKSTLLKKLEEFRKGCQKNGTDCRALKDIEEMVR